MVIVKEDKAKKEPVKEDIVEKFKSMVDGSDIKTLKKQFTIDQLKVIANSYDVEVDDSDTKDSILKAILEE